MLRYVSRATCLIACTLACAAAAGEAGPSEKLSPAADEKLAFALDARGVQIYTCKAGADGAYKWTFVAPEATLLENGAVVGTHGAGPTWTSPTDYSSVKGAVRERQDGGAGNIPWLLLTGTSQGSGRFAAITSVQRLDTRGGVEPASPCDASLAGREERVAYTAVYKFYRKGTGY